MYIKIHTECQVELFGERSTQVCTNLFLTGQFQLKAGLFEESKANSAIAITMLEELKDKFEDDYAILAIKYYLQAANINFIMANYQEARKNALKGLQIIETSPASPDIQKSVDNSKRDLLNIKIRSTAKLDNIDPWKMREEEAEAHQLGVTLMPDEA